MRDSDLCWLNLSRGFTQNYADFGNTANRNTIIPWVFADSWHGYADKVPKSISGKPLIARLRELRKRHVLTQEKFSELSGVAYKYYQLIEGGHRVDLRLSTLEKLAMAYGIGVHELLAPNFPKVRLPKSTAKKSKRTA